MQDNRLPKIIMNTSSREEETAESKDKMDRSTSSSEIGTGLKA
jgi:hypothetical protein